MEPLRGDIAILILPGLPLSTEFTANVFRKPLFFLYSEESWWVPKILSRIFRLICIQILNVAAEFWVENNADISGVEFHGEVAGVVNQPASGIRAVCHQ